MAFIGIPYSACNTPLFDLQVCVKNKNIFFRKQKRIERETTTKKAPKPSSNYHFSDVILGSIRFEIPIRKQSSAIEIRNDGRHANTDTNPLEQGLS